MGTDGRKKSFEKKEPKAEKSLPTQLAEREKKEKKKHKRKIGNKKKERGVIVTKHDQTTLSRSLTTYLPYLTLPIRTLNPKGLTLPLSLVSTLSVFTFPFGGVTATSPSNIDVT